ncbi:hypothetical protein [Companilactobacillus mishanensis]|uniref:DUF1433 domain-containing protein n=1 Tax=Companilactobacillus mishanensis TaxID=2486008 RepID=A0ABW9P8F1_9LACO|nr:hypothetical protein [Companilactobacillus mishanensis]MQS45515.1 hypothetical protein [Companilactobacillus mishanensis]
MTNKKKSIISVTILVTIVLIGSIIFGIDKFKNHQKEERIQQEKFHKNVENKIVENICKKFTGIKSVTFTNVSTNHSNSGYTYSFFVNNENSAHKREYLWDYMVLGDKTLASMGYPNKGSFAFRNTSNSDSDVPQKYLRSNPLKKFDISKIKINYRLRVDK